MSGILLTRQSVIFAKLEGTYGTEPSGVTDATNAVLTTIPEFSFDVETYERNLARKSLSPLSPRVTNVNCALSFSCELRGANPDGATKNTVPDIGALLGACGFDSSTDTAGVFYKPDSAIGKSVTIYMYQGDAGQLKKITGCVGNVSFSVEQGGIGLANFEFQGQFDGTAAFGSGNNNVSIPSADYQATVPPIAQNIAFSYNGNTALDITNFELNMNNEIQNIKSMNGANKTATNFFLSGRSPSGSFNPLIETDMTTDDVIADLENSTNNKLKFTLGSTDGNKVSIFCGGTESSGSVTQIDAVTLTNIGFEDDNGLARYNCEFMLGASFDTGNDEVIIQFH